MVGADGGCVGGYGAAELEAFVGGAGAEEFFDVAEQFGGVDFAELEADLAGFETREVEQLLDHAQHALGFLLDDAEGVLASFGGGDGAIEQGLEKPRMEVSGVRSSWLTSAMKPRMARSLSPTRCAMRLKAAASSRTWLGPDSAARAS